MLTGKEYPKEEFSSVVVQLGLAEKMFLWTIA